MSMSKYQSTRETTNLARVARIILGPCADVLRDVLRKNISPPDLSQKVVLYIAKLTNINRSPLTKEQLQLVRGEDYSTFDITLLCILLRTFCSMFPKLWSTSPSPGDRSVAANIERIRLIRNEFGHTSEISITDIEFNKKWQEIFNTIQELEKYLGSATDYQDAVKEIKTCNMTPEKMDEYIKQLLDLNKKVQDIRGNNCNDFETRTFTHVLLS